MHGLLTRYRKLLASPTFHRGVHKIHKAVRQARHGPDLEEMGGTKIDNVNSQSIVSVQESLVLMPIVVVQKMAKAF